MFKEYFLKRKADLEAKKIELQKRSDESEDLAEVKDINARLQEIAKELADITEQLAKAEESEAEAEGTNDGDENTGDTADTEREAELNMDTRNFDPAKAVNVASVDMTQKQEERAADPRSTMEYRTAFKDFVQRGVKSDVLQYEKRTDATGTSADLGVLIPTTVMQEIITGVQGVYGQLYSRVRKTNLKGGVKYPIGSFNATFNRIAETAVSFRQDAGGVTGSIDFTYKIGEIRLARTLLQTVLSVPVFEQEFAKVCAEAYVKAMDTEIMTGTDANNQCVGILTEAAATNSRIPAGNIISFTAAEAADWTEWQTKLFAKIPLAMRSERPEFVMTAGTYESVIKTLKDDVNRPVYYETFNPVDGAERATFKGREVVFVENDILKDFGDASNNEYFGMLWVPEKAYAINSNLEFSVVDYFDHETNQYIKKAIVINDGKVLDGSRIFLLKKSVSG